MPSPKSLSPENWSERRFISFDKTAVFYRRYSPSGTPRALLLVLHGMGEHGGRYQEFVEALREAGVEAYVPDLRGFGQSGGKKGCLHSFEDYFRDLDAVAGLAKKEFPGLPFFVMGHSFGGLVASSWLSRQKENSARGLVLTSPNFGIAIHVPIWRQALAAIAAVLAPDFTQDNRVDSNFLTHDPGIVEKSKVDRFNHHRISARLYLEMTRQLAQKKEIAARLRLPLLVLQAGDDRVVSRQDTAIFYEHLASKDKRLEVFPGLYHEILNETCRREIYAKIADWLKQRI